MWDYNSPLPLTPDLSPTTHLTPDFINIRRKELYLSTIVNMYFQNKRNLWDLNLNHYSNMVFLKVIWVGLEFVGSSGKNLTQPFQCGTAYIVMRTFWRKEWADWHVCRYESNKNQVARGHVVYGVSSYLFYLTWIKIEFSYLDFRKEKIRQIHRQ